MRMKAEEKKKTQSQNNNIFNETLKAEWIVKELARIID